MNETVHINELLEGSSVYGDTAGMQDVQVVITEQSTYVSYLYDENLWLDIWHCTWGEVAISECDEPDVRYTGEDPEYHLIQPLIDKIQE